tara:strand:- start:1173 stop:1907 length:735 start_codon:yes stop_codon:yes gene_type:complete
MKIIKNKISNIPKMPCEVDNLDDLPYIPIEPLPIKSFAMYIVGSPGSGKTNLLIGLLTSKKPKYYKRFFDRVELISESLQTLPKTFLKLLNEEQQHNKFNDELIYDIVTKMKTTENDNNLIVIDDCIRSINRSKNLSKLYLNRRHITHDNNKEGNGGLAIITTSQKYTLLPLEFRNANSDIILFKTSNAMELNKIKDELLYDLDKDKQDELLNMAWKDKYNFLYVKVNAPLDDKYYINFDKVIF